MYQLEFFGNFFSIGDPRRNWSGNGSEDKTIDEAKRHYLRNAASNKQRGYSVPPNRIRDLETGEIVVANKELEALLNI